MNDNVLLMKQIDIGEANGKRLKCSIDRELLVFDDGTFVNLSAVTDYDGIASIECVEFDINDFNNDALVAAGVIDLDAYVAMVHKRQREVDAASKKRDRAAYEIFKERFGDPQ